MKVSKCRICGNLDLREILNLGYQKYTGVFPHVSGEEPGGGVLRLVKCSGEGCCGLVQLAESFDPNEMYGENYGYHSSLNASMVNHLGEITNEILEQVKPKDDDVILDIGSNDGTLLGTYLKHDFKGKLVGMDPSGGKFKEYYADGIQLIEDFFSARKFLEETGDRKVKIITSIAMFYDLEDPIAFAKDIEAILDDEGIWVIEQSYLPSMVATTSYDTVCHEHIEFYSLKQIKYIAEHVGLTIIKVSLNDTNGGSFRVTMAKRDSAFEIDDSVGDLYQQERTDNVDSPEYFDEFVKKIDVHKKMLLDFLNEQKAKGRLVLGYGASTKGNVVLQYCGITRKLLPAIAEVNSDKFGCVTPGTDIPIISEDEARRMNPDYYVVLPWHFKNNILEKEKQYRDESGVKFVFYLPEFEIV